MAVTKYTHSITTDTANSALDLDSYISEISESSITIAIDHVNVIGDVIDTYFKTALSGGEESTLDSVVASHQGISAEPEPPTVQLSSQTASGRNEVAITKPDGNAKTYISHNFCDNTTWPETDDSKWSLSAPSGKKYKIYKAEVQFSHDVKMKTAVTPKQMKLDVMAGGYPVAEESKTFSSMADVFDLGNKHYSMNVEVDGLPGMTTVVFDYANIIELYASMGMSMDFYINDDTEFEGTHCSVSLIAELVDE